MMLYMSQSCARETIISLDALDKEGCTTQISKGRLRVYLPTGNFMFSAFLHAGRYFLDTEFYYGYAIQKKEQAMILTDAKYDNTAELWVVVLGMSIGLT